MFITDCREFCFSTLKTSPHNSKIKMCLNDHSVLLDIDNNSDNIICIFSYNSNSTVNFHWGDKIIQSKGGFQKPYCLYLNPLTSKIIFWHLSIILVWLNIYIQILILLANLRIFFTRLIFLLLAHSMTEKIPWKE